MADELTIKAQVIYNPEDGSLRGINSGLLEKIISLTGTDFTVASQEIGTDEEEIVVTSDIGTLGYVLIVNEGDETVNIGFADVATADDARPISLLPDEFTLFRAGDTLYASAEANTTVIRTYAFEE